MSTRTMLKSKIHRARVTDCNIDYEGSVTIDNELLKAADILPYERVEILNVHNGARFSTYALEGAPGSGDICLNGAAARLASLGDIVIILTYHEVPHDQAPHIKPRMVYVDEHNRIKSTKCRCLDGRPGSHKIAAGPVTCGTPSKIQDMKRAGDKITMLTAYDYSTAKIVDEAGVPLILVGDTLGMVMLGHETTVPVTMDEMLHHAKAVVRGTRQSPIIGDMPFMTYQITMTEAMRNAARFMQEAGCQAVKLEGGVVVADTLKRIVDCGIPVMGHIGLTPQSIHQLSGHRVQGKTADSARRLLNDAIALEQAGAFAVVLELVPTPLAKIITARLKIPTIGIGAGPYCDGQVQVIHDMLGLFTDFVPKHAKQYAKLAVVIKSAIGEYINETKSGIFPSSEHGSTMDEGLLKDL